MNALREPFPCQRRISAPLAVLVLLGALPGCRPGSRDEWPRAAVEGTVTLDGVPLQNGTLTFFPGQGNRGPAAGAVIVQGRFALPKHEGPVVGKNRIEIRSVQKTGRMVPAPSAVEADGPPQEGMLVEEFADQVPQRYNTYSELECEVSREGSNVLELKLLSDPAGPGEKRDES